MAGSAVALVLTSLPVAGLAQTSSPTPPPATTAPAAPQTPYRAPRPAAPAAPVARSPQYALPYDEKRGVFTFATGLERSLPAVVQALQGRAKRSVPLPVDYEQLTAYLM